MALNTFECNYLTPLYFKGLKVKVNARAVAAAFCRLISEEFRHATCAEIAVLPADFCDCEKLNF